MNISHTRQYRAQRGTVAVMAAVVLVIVFGMLALAIDIGYIAHVNTELQRTADACAMAAVMQLPNQAAAIAAAQQVAEKNKGADGPSLAISDIQFGDWDRDTAKFVPTNNGPNAVKISAERSAAKGTPLALFFAPAIGKAQASVAATAIAIYDNSLCGPLVGIQWVSVPGDPSTDSFRSEDGSYASQTPRDNGDVCSNGPISLEGTAIVRGDANPGRGYQTTTVGTSMVTGNKSPRLRPLNLPDVDASPYQFNNDNSTLPLIKKGNNFVSPVSASGDFLLDGGRTYAMPPGTYYFRNLTLTGQSTLNISGPTTIYLTGNLDTSGGYLVNNTQIASNLQILIQGSASSTAIVTSSVDFYAVIYAPKTAVETRGNAGFFGAVVGKTLTVTGTGDIHYDEDLNLESALDLPKRITLVQ